VLSVEANVPIDVIFGWAGVVSAPLIDVPPNNVNPVREPALFRISAFPMVCYAGAKTPAK